MKISKSRLKQIIKEELQELAEEPKKLYPGVWYGPEAEAERHRLLFPDQYEDEDSLLDPEKAAELAAVFGDEADLSADDEAAFEYAREADDEGWGWSSLEENKMKITKSQLKRIIKEELGAALSEGAIRNAWRRAQPGWVHSEDADASLRHAQGADAHLNPSIDTHRDQIDHQRSFGPERVEDKARELASLAGAEDDMTYDWKYFIEEAKEELMRTGI
jgi:hypothetical protein